jgi:hypothetical protein
MILDERDRIELNLRTIREYLAKGFTGFQLTEDASDPTVCHRFTVTDVKTFEQYKLKIGWARLSEITNNPEKMNRSLVNDDVVARMRKAKGHYVYW